MDKVKLIALIASLYALEIDARAEMVKNTAKENNLKEGELFKLLKKAGYEPKAPKDTAAPNEADVQLDNDQDNGEKVTVLASHKTEYDRYRCAGLVLTRKPENYLVTEAQLEKLEHDPWVVVSK